MVNYLQNLTNRIEHPEKSLRPRPVLRFENLVSTDGLKRDESDDDDNAADRQSQQNRHSGFERRSAEFTPPSKHFGGDRPSTFETSQFTEQHRESEIQKPVIPMPPHDSGNENSKHVQPPDKERQQREAQQDDRIPTVASLPVSHDVRPPSTAQTAFDPPPGIKPPIIPVQRIQPPEKPVISERIVEHVVHESRVETALSDRGQLRQSVRPTPPNSDFRPQPNQNTVKTDELSSPVRQTLSEAPSRTVHISIGRIEVRVNKPQTIQASPAKPTTRPTAPSMSLTDYLQRRNDGEL